MSKIFHKNALNVVAEFDSIMKNNGFTYYLMWGSLLGAIREHGFIPHDFDFDIAIWNEYDSDKIKEVLENNGFILDHDQVVDKGKLARHQMYVKKNVNIDFFWFFPPVDKLPYTCLYKPLYDALDGEESRKKYGGVRPIRCEMPFDRRERYEKFENLLLPVPYNAEEILGIAYGEDFMIPNPNWAPQENPSYKVIWKDKIAVLNKI